MAFLLRLSMLENRLPGENKQIGQNYLQHTSRASVLEHHLVRQTLHADITRPADKQTYDTPASYGEGCCCMQAERHKGFKGACKHLLAHFVLVHSGWTP